MSSGAFPVRTLSVPSEKRHDEQLGTKAKFWFREEDGLRSLFKRGRANEDWSEKVGAECARCLGLPHAEVELALCDGEPGIVSRTFLREGEELTHGNELLLSFDEAYPQEKRYHVAEHTVDAVFDALKRCGASAGDVPGLPEDADARDVFVGYLLLDAWIGNTDRHHENWAIVRGALSTRIAPTYDHASSLGRNETPERMSARLTGRDPRMTVEAYAEKARSALFASRKEVKPLTTVEAFQLAASKRPAAGNFWLNRLRDVPPVEHQNLLGRVPPERISELNRTFAGEILTVNRLRLLDTEA